METQAIQLKVNSGLLSRALLLAQVFLVLFVALASGQQLYLGFEEIVQADGFDIEVPGYSVPSFVHWNNDGAKDLVVGEGSSAFSAMIRVYLNIGTEFDPQFADFFYAQSEGSNLTIPGCG